MIVTNDEGLAEKCKSYRNLCFRPTQRFVHDEIGWNYRMTNLQAALGVAQLEQIDLFLVRKREVGKLYQSLLSGLEDKVILPLIKTDFAENIYWVFGMILKDPAKMNAKEMMEKLHSKGIGSRPFFFPMHLQPVYNKMGWYTNESYENAEKMAEYGFYIPSGLGITDDEIKEVARIVREILA